MAAVGYWPMSHMIDKTSKIMKGVSLWIIMNKIAKNNWYSTLYAIYKETGFCLNPNNMQF
jgi:hypothetical protein